MTIPPITGQAMAGIAAREAIQVFAATGGTTVVVTATGIVVPVVVAGGLVALTGLGIYAGMKVGRKYLVGPGLSRPV